MTDELTLSFVSVDLVYEILLYIIESTLQNIIYFNKTQNCKFGCLFLQTSCCVLVFVKIKILFI